MRKVAVALLGCLAIVGLSGQAAMAVDGHKVIGVSATPNTPVPSAAVVGNNGFENSCADALQQTLANQYEMKIVEASQTWYMDYPAYVYTLVGNGKRTLILFCSPVNVVVN